ncbi:MAG: transglycosylase SLT domain-containing protein [Zoogloea sp.]|nr:transglycosylase SLT domain-containing protein [Zoogloea sp.]
MSLRFFALLLAWVFGLPLSAYGQPAGLRPSPEITRPAESAIALPSTAAPLSSSISDLVPPQTRVPTIDLTAEPTDLWERIRRGFAMPDLNSDLVTDRQIYYINRPGELRRIVERGQRYLFYIVEELERRGMPTELALLPMVESAFNPMAYSRAHASGLWQFIPSTGKKYDLEQNGWIDERRDIIASTNAALDYLQTIYEMHGDWQLALASYNWGEGAVGRAIAKNRAAGLPTEYSYLNMPGETRYYVPKLQALKNIIARPELFGLSLPTIPNRPYFATVETKVGLDLPTAARLAETPIEEFVALNPGYKRPLTRGGIQSLVIPAAKMDAFMSNLASHDPSQTDWRSYDLQPGERNALNSMQPDESADTPRSVMKRVVIRGKHGHRTVVMRAVKVSSAKGTSRASEKSTRKSSGSGKSSAKATHGKTRSGGDSSSHSSKKSSGRKHH